MTWLYKGLPYNPPEDFTTDDLYGFVYLITNRANAKKYVGKKFFWSKQFEREVLLTDEYYNGIINCKIGAPSVKTLIK